MRRLPNILEEPHLATLAAFASSNVLLGFDYDGTLAPIVATPSRARMRATTRSLLADVASRYPCVVISGRRFDDIRKRLTGIPVWQAFGNFGHEPGLDNSRTSEKVRVWMQLLAARLPQRAGVFIEEKKYSITIHYRRARDKRRARLAITNAVSGLPDVRVIEDVAAVNLLVATGPNKGLALQQARRQFACDHTIYVGDDATDEDAFKSEGPDRLLSIRIGGHATSLARYHLKCQPDIDILLHVLVSLRPRETPAPATPERI